MSYPLDLEDYDDSSGSADDYRTHFIDNLRTTLTVLLIVQHAIIETAASSYPYFASTPLTLFVFMCKTLLVGLFFFISGYAASVSRAAPAPSYAYAYAYYPGARRSDASFVWRRSVRLLFPAVVYGIFGHIIVWMVLTKSWPAFFGGAGSLSASSSAEDGYGYGYATPQTWGFARFEGPVVHILFLWVLDMGYVFFKPAKRGGGAGVIASTRHPVRTTIPASKSDSERSSASSSSHRLSPLPPSSSSSHTKRKTPRLVKIRSTRAWLRLSLLALTLLALWTFAATASGRSESSPLVRFGFNVAAYDAIVPAAPFQHVLAYMAGVQLWKWQKYMLVPGRYVGVAFFGSIVASVSVLYAGISISPSMREIVQLNTPWPVHPSFVDGGFNLHTLFFSVWNALTFYGVGTSVVSLYAQWEWTRRDWGVVARCSYVPVWVHMVPVVVFGRMLAADGGSGTRYGGSGGSSGSGGWSGTGQGQGGTMWKGGLESESVVWRCFLVATGSTLCSWLVGLGVAGVGWVCGC